MTKYKANFKLLKMRWTFREEESGDEYEKIAKALSAIKSAYGTETDEYEGTLFISHHLIELDVEYWKKYTDKEMPTPEDILNIIELKEIWDDGKLALKHNVIVGNNYWTKDPIGMVEGRINRTKIFAS